MRRVLVTGGYNIGKAGVATIVYRWGQNFDSNKIVYDYLMANGLPEERYVEAIHEKGGKILTPTRKVGGIKRLFWMLNAMKSYPYEVIHINIDVAYKALVFILLAKFAGIKKIALHSHCAFVDEANKVKRRIKTLLHYICRGYCIRKSDVLLACSKEAAQWMFGDRIAEQGRYNRIFNGLDIGQFKFNEKLRTEYRNKFKIAENEYILCNIGRFSYQKNHHLLIDIFEEYIKINGNSRLFLVGEGELKEEIAEYVKSKELNDKVHFLGLRDDINELLNMMDVFVMTSRFEGLPLVLVESQIASLPCVVSDSISKETEISDYVSFVEGSSAVNWIESIEKYRGIKRQELAIRDIEQYAIEEVSRNLQEILEKC